MWLCVTTSSSYTQPLSFSDRSKTRLKQSHFSAGSYKIQPLLSRKGKERVKPTTVLADMLQVTSAMKVSCKKHQRELQIGNVKTPLRKVVRFIAANQKCMHEAVYYHSVFIGLVWNMPEEEE